VLLNGKGGSLDRSPDGYPEEVSPCCVAAMPDDGPGLRASHEDRDRVVDALRIAGGDGRLTAEELDTRLEIALTARTLGELAGLTASRPAAPVARERYSWSSSTAAGTYGRDAGRYPRASNSAPSCAGSPSTSPTR
jgi:hypothetical protein